MNFKGKKEVVKAVQKLLGVSADGADGPVTWNAILAKMSTKNPIASGGSIAEKMVSLAELTIASIWVLPFLRSTYMKLAFLK